MQFAHGCPFFVVFDSMQKLGQLYQLAAALAAELKLILVVILRAAARAGLLTLELEEVCLHAFDSSLTVSDVVTQNQQFGLVAVRIVIILLTDFHHDFTDTLHLVSNLLLEIAGLRSVLGHFGNALACSCKLIFSCV